MKRNVTLMDICRRVGVSSATVSRVINGSPLVVEATRLKVEKAIQELGYRPNYAARMLARARTDTVAVIIPTLGRDYFMEVLAAVDRVTVAHRYHVLIAISHSLKDENELLQKYVRERRADGVIILALENGLEAGIRKAAAGGMPIVAIGQAIKAPQVGSVVVDNRGGAESMVLHLLEQGYRRLALLAGPRAVRDSAERLTGALETAARLGHPIPEDRVWPCDFSAHMAYLAVKEHLAPGRTRPDALFALNDDMALGARSAIKELGLRIPEDIALAGFDDVPAMHHVGLTSVQNPMESLGRTASEMMMARLKNDAKAMPQIVLPARLMARASTQRAG